MVKGKELRKDGISVKVDTGKVTAELGCPIENVMKIKSRENFKKKLNTKKKSMSMETKGQNLLNATLYSVSFVCPFLGTGPITKGRIPR